MKGTVLRVVSGGAVVAALMTLIALPASAAVVPPAKPLAEVGSPGENAFEPRGSLWVTGVACDPNASMTDPTSGIASVRVFMRDRDDPSAGNEPSGINGRGGYLGGATVAGTLGTGSGADIGVVAAETSRLGIGSGDVSMCKNPNAGWRVLTSPLRRGAYVLHIYVLGKNGAETELTRGIRVGVQ
jgi:hypothetical protein